MEMLRQSDEKRETVREDGYTITTITNGPNYAEFIRKDGSEETARITSLNDGTLFFASCLGIYSPYYKTLKGARKKAKQFLNY